MAYTDGVVRPLQYPLDRSLDIESETQDESPVFLDLRDWQTTDNDERVSIVINLSLNEYVALASAVDAGRDLTYGDESIYIWWLWTRILYSMNICDDIINCINDSESGVADAIQSIISNPSADSVRETAQSYNNFDLADGSNPSCDLDILYGQCRQMVDYLDQQHTDVFEIIEVITNIYEQVAAIFGNQQGTTAQLIAIMTETLSFIQNSIAENYAAQITTAYKEELACEWFCMAKDNGCELTPTIMYDVMKDRLSSSIDITDLFYDALDFLVTGSWSGSQIADFMFFLNFASRSQLGRWLTEYAWSDITWHMVAFSNDPDSDWETLCDCPVEKELMLCVSTETDEDVGTLHDTDQYDAVDSEEGVKTWRIRLIVVEQGTSTPTTGTIRFKFTEATSDKLVRVNNDAGSNSPYYDYGSWQGTDLRNENFVPTVDFEYTNVGAQIIEIADNTSFDNVEIWVT